MIREEDFITFPLKKEPFNIMRPWFFCSQIIPSRRITYDFILFLIEYTHAFPELCMLLQFFCSREKTCEIIFFSIHFLF